MPTKKKKYFQIVLWNLLTTLVLLSGIEYYLDLKLRSPASSPSWLLPLLKSYYTKSGTNIIQFNPELAQYDSVLFYKLKPGRSTFENFEFQNRYDVNHLGIRDDQNSLLYPRMIALGDSYTMGWGVEQEETYPQILEQRLGYPVLNLGISSYGTAREIKALERIRTDSLEYLIIQYCPNDILENKTYMLAEQSLHVSSPEVYAEACRKHLKSRRYYFLKHTISVATSLRNSEAPIPKKNRQLDNIHAEKAFLQIIRNSKKIPPTAKIIVFALEAEQTNNAFITAVQKLLQLDYSSSLTDRMSFIDLTGQIDSSHRFILDPHLNFRGHQVVANHIATHLDTLPSYSGQKVWFYPTGDTSIVCFYQNGTKHGPFRAFWKNGQVSLEVNYENGVKVGTEISFDTTGAVLAKKMH